MLETCTRAKNPLNFIVILKSNIIIVIKKKTKKQKPKKPFVFALSTWPLFFTVAKNFILFKLSVKGLLEFIYFI